MRKQVLLFDLGDTLIYRERTHKEFDIDLLMNIASRSKEEVEEVLNRNAQRFPEIYDFSLTNNFLMSLEGEKLYTIKFFDGVFEDLGIGIDSKEFYVLRSTEKRYNLFPQTEEYLSELSKKYNLGVLTNGRPSRRTVITYLGIDKYFEDRYIFISDEIGAAKPNMNIFTHVGDILQDFTIVLIDDEQRNISAANTKGLNTIMVNSKRDANHFTNLDTLL